MTMTWLGTVVANTMIIVVSIVTVVMYNKSIV